MMLPRPRRMNRNLVPNCTETLLLLRSTNQTHAHRPASQPMHSAKPFDGTPLPPLVLISQLWPKVLCPSSAICLVHVGPPSDVRKMHRKGGRWCSGCPLHFDRLDGAMSGSGFVARAMSRRQKHVACSSRGSSSSSQDKPKKARQGMLAVRGRQCMRPTTCRGRRHGQVRTLHLLERTSVHSL